MTDGWGGTTEDLHPDVEHPDLRAQRLAPERVTALLSKGTFDTTHGLMPWSSNYTFLVTVSNETLETLAVYKPCSGERPLWDFPHHTLCLRECASYLISEALGWPHVSPTVVREGPRGRGAVQLFIHADAKEHYFTMQESERFAPDFQRIAAFDVVVNNADRKSGHCLKGKDDRVWAIDHGLTFHAQWKLRTVIWEFADAPLPDDVLSDLDRLYGELGESSALTSSLLELLSEREMAALRHRTHKLLQRGTFPEPDLDRRSTPWPPV